MTIGSPVPAVHRPGAFALGLVRLATTLLPPGDLRQRYRCELVADLQYLDRPRQLSYATGVLSIAWALREELTKESAMDDTTSTPTIPLLCRLNLRHRWHLEFTEDNTRYSRCLRCGKDNPRLGGYGLGGGGGFAAPG
jgi:hypothetical protein